MALNLKYKFGLVNSEGKYLTAEKFGGKVNASGPSLKARQVWTLEQEQESSAIYLKGPSNNYLSADKNGNVYCDCDNRERQAEFEVVVQDDGKWALRNIVQQRFLEGNSDELRCSASAISKNSIWTVQLAIHPQVCMKSYHHQKYAHLKTCEDGEDSVVVEDLVPWGADSTITLVYLGDGKYSLEAFNGKFVQTDGNLVDAVNAKTQFTLLFQSGHLALRDNEGRNLGVDSGSKVLKSSTKGGRHNYFILEDSCPQGAFELENTGKYASLKQGEDVSFKLMNDEIGDTETFQLEFVERDTYAIRVCDSKNNPKFWKVKDRGIQANGTSKTDASCQFKLEYDGKYVRLQAKDGGKYVGVRDNGHLFVQDSPKDFLFRLLNRPKLVLKCEHGFVGITKGKAEVNCNKSNFDVFNVTYKEGGYTIQDVNGRYWSCDDSSRIVLGEAAGVFFFEFHELSKFAIRAESNGMLIKGEQNGLFNANGSEVGKGTLWEF